MREIKFRAWDTQHSCMVNDVTPDPHWNGDTWQDVGISGEHYRADPSEFILMQFTGLRDKNGREIYEGDILKRPDFGSLWRAEFHDGCFVRYSVANGYSAYLNNDDNMEVVGNIYESPELIDCQRSE